jgi:chaperonin cofactor prefoldin
MRYIESEVEGEKPITRTVLEQSIRNGAQLDALRSEVATSRVDIQALGARVDAIIGDLVQNTAAIRNHGTLLTMVQQDVVVLRSDATELRRGQEAISARIDRLESTTNTRIDRLESTINTTINALREEAATRHAELLAAIAALRPA